MSYDLYDANGYLTPGPSATSLVTFAAWADDDPTLRRFIDTGYAPAGVLAAALARRRADGDVELTRLELLEAATRADEVLIVSDGQVDEPTALGDVVGHPFHGNQWTTGIAVAQAKTQADNLKADIYRQGAFIADNPDLAEHVDVKRLPKKATIDQIAAMAPGKIALADAASAEARIEQKAQELLAGAHVAVRVPMETLTQIVDDGKLKTQFETGTSRGDLDTKARAEVEEHLFGTPPDQVADRPVYGFAYDKINAIRYESGHPQEGYFATKNVGQYGDVSLLLKDEVKNRTTLTSGDSLFEYDKNFRQARTAVHTGEDPNETRFAPVTMTDTQHARLGFDLHENRALLRKSSIDDVVGQHGVVETQIHGGVKLSDIDKVVIHYQSHEFHKVDPDTLDALEKAGIPIEVRAPDYHGGGYQYIAPDHAEWLSTYYPHITQAGGKAPRLPDFGKNIKATLGTPRAAGDVVGHPFHGNQYTGGRGKLVEFPLEDEQPGADEFYKGYTETPPRDSHNNWSLIDQAMKDAALKAGIRPQGPLSRDIERRLNDPLEPYALLKGEAETFGVAHAYHGTAKAALDSIMKDGLVSGHSGADEWAKAAAPRRSVVFEAGKALIDGRSTSVYLTGSRADAEQFGRFAAETLTAKTGVATEPIVLEVKIPEDAIGKVKLDEFSHGVRFEGKIEPSWITIADMKKPYDYPPARWETRAAEDAAGKTFHVVFIVAPELTAAEGFDASKHPRDEHGRFADVPALLKALPHVPSGPDIPSMMGDRPGDRGGLDIAKILGKPIADYTKVYAGLPASYQMSEHRELVPIDKLIPTQSTISDKVTGRSKSSIGDYLSGRAGLDDIDVTRRDGKLYIENGHHRVVAAKLLGRQKIGANVTHIFEPRQAEFDESKHPRDEKGRWTDAGGTERSADDRHTDIDFATHIRSLGYQTTTVADMPQDLRRQLNVDYARQPLPKAVAAGVEQALKDVEREAPELAKYLKEHTKFLYAEYLPAAGASAVTGRHDSYIIVNGNPGALHETLKEKLTKQDIEFTVPLQRVKGMPAGDERIKEIYRGMLVHEMGHIADRNEARSPISLALTSALLSSKEGTKSLANFTKHVSKTISPYAARAGVREAAAEIFTSTILKVPVHKDYASVSKAIVKLGHKRAA